MKLTLLTPKEYTNMTLPENCAGHYWVQGRNADGRMTDIIAVEAVRSAENGEPQWMMKSNRRYKVIDSQTQEILQSIVLKPLELFRIQSADGKRKYTLYTEPLSLDRKQYRGYELIGEKAVISIGRIETNQICYSNKCVTGNHAEITISAEDVSVRDLGSTNNTYVNGKAVERRQLKIGDVVYIMGLQIIVANCAVFLNNPDGMVSVRSKNLREYHAPAQFDRVVGEEEFEDIPFEYYYRAPRFKHDAEEFELKIDAPPANSNTDDVPMIMVVGPSLTMGMASVASGGYTIFNAVSSGNVGAAIPSMIMSVSMLFGTLMWPLVTKTYQKKLSKRREIRRQETYKEYLAQMEKLIERETVRQQQILRDNDANTSTCVKRIQASVPQIWERTSKHKDFLSLHLGYGKLPLKANIQYSERKFTVEKDELVEMMYEFGETKRWLSDVPICLSISEHFISGLYAEREILLSYAKSIILRIVALHSYDEVKLVLLYDESLDSDFSFVRWLPHTMDNERTVRYIATNSDEAKELSAVLDPIIEYRKGLNDSMLEDETPYFVILSMDKKLASKAECVRRILKQKENVKFSVVSIYEKLVDLPKECSAVVELGKNGRGNLTVLGDVSDPPISFRTDMPQQIDMVQITQVLANIYVETGTSEFKFPRKYTFMEMLNIGMVEHLNLLDNWAANDPTKSLAAAVGIDKYGETLKLDLHQEAHGPHGLVAGMTGSGKSEFIISYILSMAVSFHPYEVAFILIDYKGGGMAKAFEQIPHTAGIITNLDGNGIKRSLVSMQSELHRRERIFAKTSQRYSVSNIDIYKYQKLYREGKVSDPLPHLFIISDEFAELKKEQPDFMTELTSTARVGRSLGVHLILATQKPGGVVDDQIRSNSRFRICLKVQDGGDSMEMLGRTEAAALTDTGRFYLQVGYNEIFEMGQSAWAGAPYYPSAKVIKDLDDAVSVINTNGRVIAEANTERYATVDEPRKQLDIITGYISRVCEEEGIKRWKMWLDPIPARVYIDELAEKYNERREESFVLDPIVGEFDDPAHQSQNVLRVPITSEGNVIVYGSTGNGKAMFVEAMCYSLMSRHTPDEINIYIMDFGAETMTAFAESPFVGDVILSYETEKISNLFKLMLGKLDTRKKMLSAFGGDLLQYNRQAKKTEPSMLIVINNYAAFAELYEDKVTDLNYLSREGTKYGIYFVLTSTGVNNVRFSLLQNFRLRYCLRLNNEDDYSSVIGKTEGLLPEKYKGRGIFRQDEKNLFEFQTACITREDPPYASIRKFSKQLSVKYSGKRATCVPVLPEKVSEQFLASAVMRGELKNVPIGVEKASLNISFYDFSANVVSLVLAVNQEWQEFTYALGRLVSEYCDIDTYLFSPAGYNSAGQRDKYISDRLKVFADSDGCAKAVREIFELVLRRNNEYKDRLSEGRELPKYQPVFVIIQSMSLLKTMLERYKPAAPVEQEAADDTLLNRLQLAMERSSEEYNVHFLVAESLGALTPLTVENWYKTHVNGNNGIWVGNGISTQYRLNVSKKPGDYLADIDSDFGFVVRNAAATLIKLLQ